MFLISIDVVVVAVVVIVVDVWSRSQVTEDLAKGKK
jgi:hypothetical protein